MVEIGRGLVSMNHATDTTRQQSAEKDTDVGARHKKGDCPCALLYWKVVRRQRLRRWVATRFADTHANACKQEVQVAERKPGKHRHCAPHGHRP